MIKEGETMEKSFNLVVDPWIAVIEADSNDEVLISLEELFAHPSKYRQLAGDTATQDLALLRFLLAILTTVYSRVDAEDEAYSWLELDDNLQVVEYDDDVDSEVLEETYIETWQDLFEQQEFTAAVSSYLTSVKDKFNFFGDKAFYQVTLDEYNDMVIAKKAITEKSIQKRTGTVALKQINRRISESNNSPAIFAPKSPAYKNELSIPELIRWLITYQNYTGVTDKTKIDYKEKFSTSPGWLYKLNSVYAVGENLFETLMLNLVLFENEWANWSFLQKPVWEFESPKKYVAERLKQQVPDNLAELYTIWARVLHIEWDGDEPIIFSAGLPIPEMDNALIEPMTTWRTDKKTQASKPATRRIEQLGQAMWRNFGSYVRVNAEDAGESKVIPELVNWLEKVLGGERLLKLSCATLISDGNATSQSPVAEFNDDLTLNASVMFDEATLDRWPTRIENEIQVTQQVASQYQFLLRRVGKLRGLDSTKEFEKLLVSKFYQRLDTPFKDWLSGLSGKDDRDEKQREWRKTLKEITWEALTEDLERIVGPRDFRSVAASEGSQEQRNIFVYISWFKASVNKILNIKVGRKDG